MTGEEVVDEVNVFSSPKRSKMSLDFLGAAVAVWAGFGGGADVVCCVLVGALWKSSKSSSFQKD